MRLATGGFIFLLCLSCQVLHAQIWGGIWISSTTFGLGTSCTDDQTDAEAMCEVTAKCTDPPNPISGFVIAGEANDRCSNQPVTNLVTIGEINSMTEHAYSHSQGVAWGRTIFTEVRTGDCNGNNTLVSTFRDPDGCAPPPPPPPPTCSGNPSFVCCGSSDGGATSPTCSNGTWSCGNACSCSTSGPFPTDCTAGQSTGCGAGGWQCFNNPGTPIIIDTDGSGFHLTSASMGVRFDIAGDGRPIQIAWTVRGSRNAWLALPDSAGNVSGGKQLFGNVTPQPASPDPNGFLALAVYDQPEKGGNGDGVIDWRDAIWPKLRLWIDSNHDGIAQPEELHTLPSLGVTSLGLAYTESKFTTSSVMHFDTKAG